MTDVAKDDLGPDADIFFHMALQEDLTNEFADDDMADVETRAGYLLPANTWEDGAPQWITVEGVFSAKGWDVRTRKAVGEVNELKDLAAVVAAVPPSEQLDYHVVYDKATGVTQTGSEVVLTRTGQNEWLNSYCISFLFIPEQTLVPLANGQTLKAKSYLATRYAGEDAWEGEVFDIDFPFA